MKARAERCGLCAVCTAMVPEGSRYTSYCSEACSRRASTRRQAGRPVADAACVMGRPRSQRGGPCARCGATVPEESRYASYCGTSCAVLAGRDRVRAGVTVETSADVQERLRIGLQPRTRNPFDDADYVRARGLAPQDVRRMRATAERLIAAVDGRETL